MGRNTWDWYCRLVYIFFRILKKCCRDTYLINFQHKFLHRVIPTNTFLFKIHIKDTKLCSFCNVEDETVEHLFLYNNLETGRIMWLGMAGGRPYRFPHNNFSSVCRIFTKLGHMIPLQKGKNLFILGSLPLYLLIIYIDGRILWCTHFLFRNKKIGILNIEQCTQGLITLVNNAQDIYFSVNFSNKTNLAI